MTNISNQIAKWKRGTTRASQRQTFIADIEVGYLEEVVGVEDLAFQLALYLITPANPQEIKNLLFVSRQWYKSFSLVQAQMRYDYLTQRLSFDAANQWLYHKIVYIPGPDEGHRSIPREGCLRIFRSHISEACKEAMHEYRFSRNNDDEHDRTDSRPDYYYKAHRETAISLELVPPRELSWACANQFTLINSIEWDKKPRLIGQYWAQIDDVNGIQSPFGSEKSKEGSLNLGYHEIVSVRDSRYARLNPRPPIDCPGEDTTEFLRVCKAKALDALRWVKFAHVIGEDQCRMFVHKNLLPMIGPRPTGNTWHKDGRAPTHNKSS